MNANNGNAKSMPERNERNILYDERGLCFEAIVDYRLAAVRFAAKLHFGRGDTVVC